MLEGGEAGAAGDGLAGQFAGQQAGGGADLLDVAAVALLVTFVAALPVSPNGLGVDAPAAQVRPGPGGVRKTTLRH